MIELYLSSDGKHTVHAKADTQSQMDELLPYATGLYEQVLKTYGTKPQLWEPVMNGRANSKAARSHANGGANGQAPAQVGRRVDTPAQAREAVNPHCQLHGTPMRYRQGKYGAFWSCPQRNPDGSWCTYTQQIAQTGNGQVQPNAYA